MFVLDDSPQINYHTYKGNKTQSNFFIKHEKISFGDRYLNTLTVIIYV